MTRAKASKHLSPQKQGYYLKEGTRLNTQKKAVFIFIKSKLHLCVSVGLCVCVCLQVMKRHTGSCAYRNRTSSMTVWPGVAQSVLHGSYGIRDQFPGDPKYISLMAVSKFTDILNNGMLFR